MSNRECWAQCLGGCSDKFSNEHTVTEGLFPSQTVRVHGWPWCKDEPKEIGLASLTRKILCTTHNSALSDIDQTGIDFFNVLRESTRLTNVRNNLRLH